MNIPQDLKEAIQAVLDSEDNTGCEDSTVVDGQAMNQLIRAFNKHCGGHYQESDYSSDLDDDEDDDWDDEDDDDDWDDEDDDDDDEDWG